MRIRITTPARIHLSLIDLNGHLGRVDGGLGICVGNPDFQIEFSNEFSSDFIYSGPPHYETYIHQFLEEFYKKYSIKPQPLAIKILKEIPEHQGLGSKTQFLLTIAKGVSEIYNRNLTSQEMAQLVHRGGTSGIGYQTFSRGGFIFDLGHSFGKGKAKQSFLPSSASAATPALPFYQSNCPSSWKILLIQLNVKQGANKTEEVNIFQDYTPLLRSDVEQISHRILMQFLPGLLEEDLHLVAESMHFINKHGFKKVEIELQDPFVGILIEKLFQKYNCPVGMSSFGPTIFLICDSDDILASIKHYIQEILKHDPLSPGGTITETIPNNIGHKIDFL